MTGSPTLSAELRGIEKSFFGRPAVRSVDLDIREGEVHGLLGENGAGKSTLCSVLAGLYRPEAGEIWVGGEQREFHSPRDALDAGVGMVYQHFRLVRTLTVAQNLVLASRLRGVRVSTREIEDQAKTLAERYRLRIHPSARVASLSVGEQQRVEILKLLHRGVRVLILDEPTAVLTPQEALDLFHTVSNLTREGASVVLVSHKLDEVERVCERITILRAGERVDQVEASEADPRRLATLMIGREFELPNRTSRAGGSTTELVVEALRVRGDRGNEAVRGVDLVVRQGEILGVAGVAGNGQRELSDAIAGLRPAEEGRIALGGGSVDLTELPVAKRLDAGLAYIPEDRLHVGTAPSLPTWVNLSLRNYRHPGFVRGPFVSKRKLRRRADDLTKRFDIRGVSPELPTRLLSGGNVQKVVLARETAGNPRALIAASPSRGLDVAAMAYVRELLLDQRAQGAAILLITEDLDELFALSDRVAVLYEGRIVGGMPIEEATPEALGLLMAGRMRGDSPEVAT